MARAELGLEDYVAGILAGERRLLSRAITLVESTKPAHEALAAALVDRLLPRTGGAIRVGITGVPGVGKSTFVEATGCMLTAAGHKVAVLAVDPSSRKTGGSILGDKTRMARLAADPAAFIRPSPTGESLGGVARATREAMLLCEAAGFDVLLIETVGVGQSETVVADMVDCFLALMLPGAGDELQGIKKGLVELADLVAINKADGDNRLRAEQARRTYAGALHLLEPASPAWRPPVLLVSALTGEGLAELWEQVLAHRRALDGTGELEAKRRRQAVSWFRTLLSARVLTALGRDPALAALVPTLEGEVEAGRLAAAAAAQRYLVTAGLAGPTVAP